MKTKKRQRVPAPYNKWITLAAWKTFSKEDRKSITDLIKLQKSLAKHYPHKFKIDDTNWNAEIEYLKSIGEH